jgi:hypothetical protein
VIGVVLVLAAVGLVLAGPLPLPTWDQYPAWWAPLALVVAGAIFLVLGERS